MTQATQKALAQAQQHASSLESALQQGKPILHWGTQNRVQAVACLIQHSLMQPLHRLQMPPMFCACSWLSFSLVVVHDSVCALAHSS